MLCKSRNVECAVCHPPAGYKYCDNVGQLSLSSSFILTTKNQQQQSRITVTTNMFPIFVLALVSYISSAIPLLSRQSKTINPFVIRASQPGSPIHLSNLNASDGHFWFGKTTSSSCPTDLEPHCPMGTETTFVVSGDGGASLVRSSEWLPTLLPSVY